MFQRACMANDSDTVMRKCAELALAFSFCKNERVRNSFIKGGCSGPIFCNDMRIQTAGGCPVNKEHDTKHHLQAPCKRTCVDIYIRFL